MTQGKAVNNTPEEADAEKPASGIDDDLELDTSEKSGKQDNKETPEKLHVIEEITELLSNENISGAVEKFNADSEEKEIAVEFANSHILFLEQIVDNDMKKGITRSEVEIRDVVSHVNVMLKNNDEYLFSTIVMHSPSHYKNMLNKILKKKKKEENNSGS